MTYRTLLVAVDRGSASDNRIGFACDLSVAMNTHLIGVCGVALAVPPMDDPYTGGAMFGEALTLFRDLAEADIRAALARFHELVGSRPASTEWRGRLGLPADVVCQAARAADLVILGSRRGGASAQVVDPADVLMAIGRPVLVLPPEPVRGPTGWPAVLAWKDSREAQRAATAALPLLRHAATVHVFESCAGDAGAMTDAAGRLADVVAWLGRHDVAADAHVGVPGEDGAAQDVLAFAEAHHAGLIVAGGYGHSRLREWALGGVTEELLTTAPVAVLLSH